MPEWGAHSLQEVGVGLAITLPLSVAYSCLLSSIGTKLGLTEKSVFGSPMFTYYCAIFGVCAYLLPPAIAAWLYSGLELEPYMRRQWLEGEAREEQFIEVFWIYAFIFHMCKDFLHGIGPLIWAHHIVCVVTALVFLSVGPPGVYTFGGAVLEIGSASNAVAVLAPDSMAVARVNLAIMTLSNLFGVWCGYITFTAVGTPAVIQWTFPPVALILTAIRELEIYKLYKETRRKSGILSGGTAEIGGAAESAESNGGLNANLS